MKLANPGLDTDTKQVAATMLVALIFGALAVAFSLWSNDTVFKGLLWAGAWSAVGWFLGFLFGIPRFLSTDTARKPASPGLEQAKKQLDEAKANATTERSKADNTLTNKNELDGKVGSLKEAATTAERESIEAKAQADAESQNEDLAHAAKAKEEVFITAKAALAAAESSAKNAAEANTAQQQEDSKAQAAVTAAQRKVEEASTNSSTQPGSSLTVNTNLEQISDWLTKIIVGVTLVEFQPMLEKMHGAAVFMAKSMAKTSELVALANAAQQSAVSASAAAASAAAASASGAASAAEAAALKAASAADAYVTGLLAYPSTESFAYALMLYFLATGLLGSYLLTRLFLQRALNDAANRDAAANSQ